MDGNWLLHYDILSFEIIKEETLATLFSAARAAFCTSRGVFAHLWTTPLCWPARDVTIVMSEKSVTICVRLKIWLKISCMPKLLCYFTCYTKVNPLCFFSSRGRVWVHHPRLSSGHCWTGDQWWQPPPITIPAVAFLPPLICIHKQTIKTRSATAGMVISSGGHYQLPFQQWPELKLRWWTQTLPRLYRIHNPPVSTGTAITSNCTYYASFHMNLQSKSDDQ